MIHLYAAPGDFPATLCGLNRVWGNPYAAVYGADLRLVNCPACLERQRQTNAKLRQVLAVEPYTADDAARLRRGFRLSLLLAAPSWAALFVAVGRWIS